MEVTAFVRYNSHLHTPWLEDALRSGQLHLVRGDIRDFDSVSRAIAGKDLIFHLAALIGIPYSFESPLAYIRTNIEGTYNVLEAARRLETKNIVVTSTSETYGSAQFVPMDESHPSVGQSPYAATKIAADQLAISYHRSFGLPVKIIRPFNTFGPRQSTRAIIPTLITQMLAGRNQIEIGNPSPTRDFTFVADTVDGFMAVANTQACNGQAVNLGTGSEISIGSLAALVAKLTGASCTIQPKADRLRPDAAEVDRLLSNNNKMRGMTGWKPNYALEEGLSRTIDWFRQYRHLYKESGYSI